jgi:4-hydroxythreonine-4-phosphate dehydrogenase
MKLPVIGITMGDPAGVGPEVVMKALARADAYALCRPLVIGDAKQLARANGILKLGLEVRNVEKAEQANFKPGAVECIQVGKVAEDIPFGGFCRGGRSRLPHIERAVQLALEHSIDAICTADQQGR